MKILQTTPAPLQKLIQRHDLMQSINDVVVNVGGLDRFESSYLPVLERFADRVQEVPLQKAAFADLGGALVCGIRASTLAVRTCDATIFSPTATAAQRLATDGHYRWLAYCSALATVYLIAAASVDVVHLRGGETEVYSWADDTHLIDWRPGYQMAWIDKPQYTFGRLSPFLPSLFFAGQFAHLPRALLSDFGLSINPALATPSAEVSLARVVRQSIERVIADEKAAMAGWVSQPTATEGALHAACPPVAPAPSPISGGGAQAPAPVAPSVETVDPQTGEILVTDPAHVAATQPDKAPVETAVQIKAREWLTGATAAAHLAGELTLLPDGRLQISRKALGFGGLPTGNFKMLHEAGLVDAKEEKSATLKAKAGDIYKAAKAIKEAA